MSKRVIVNACGLLLCGILIAVLWKRFESQALPPKSAVAGPTTPAPPEEMAMDEPAPPAAAEPSAAAAPAAPTKVADHPEDVLIDTPQDTYTKQFFETAAGTKVILPDGYSPAEPQLELEFLHDNGGVIEPIPDAGIVEFVPTGDLPTVYGMSTTGLSSLRLVVRSGSVEGLRQPLTFLVAGGHYKISIYGYGFAPLDVPIDIPAGKYLHRKILLPPRSSALSGLVVLTGTLPKPLWDLDPSTLAVGYSVDGSGFSGKLAKTPTGSTTFAVKVPTTGVGCFYIVSLDTRQALYYIHEYEKSGMDIQASADYCAYDVPMDTWSIDVPKTKDYTKSVVGLTYPGQEIPLAWAILTQDATLSLPKKPHTFRAYVRGEGASLRDTPGIDIQIDATTTKVDLGEGITMTRTLPKAP